jgi:iron complex outermembrane receptor protein
MLQRTRISIAIGAAFGAGLFGLAPAVQAQQTGQQLERVEITGTSLRRVEGETALPVTVIRGEELQKAGITTAEQAMQRISASQSTLGSSSSIGGTTGNQSTIDLRGLGVATGDSGRRTLVLLNGRRIANHAYDSGGVDINSIPVSAIDRIEVLRDGASAVYGTDAIGGVVNFILRRDFQGFEISAQLDSPTAANGDTRRATLAGGIGSLDKQGFNLFASVDYRKQDRVRSIDRSFSASGLPGQSSGTTFPGQVNGFFPLNATGCAPTDPATIGQLGGLPPTLAFPRGTACRYDFVGAIDIIPDNDQLSAFVRGSLKLAGSVISLEYLRAENNSTNRVAPTPLVGMSIPATHPNYPAGAPVLGTGNVTSFRAVPAGQRTNDVESTSERIVLDATGVMAGWDYKGGLYYSKGETADNFTNGYVNRSLVQAGINSGTINPFGLQSPAGLAAFDAAKIKANVLSAKGEATGVDFRVTRDLFQVAAGAVPLAVGAEWREEKYTYDLQDIARQAASSGLELAADISGKRQVTALFAEVAYPLSKTLEATFALRADNYDDVGGTVNPKLGLRYQPSRSLLFRGSVNTGFRAPTLYDIFQPIANTFTSDSYNDPVYCRNGATLTGAAPGDASVACDQQVQQRLAGPVALGRPDDTIKPEKSRTLSFGVVFEPVQNLTVSLDYWNVQIKDLISAIPEQAIFGNPTLYASRIRRCSQLDPATRAVIDVCASLRAPGALGASDPGLDPIGFIDTPNENLGEVRTNGLDFGFGYRMPRTDYGNFSVTFDGTYINRYDYQRGRGDAFIRAAGRYSDNAPIMRWQHAATISWGAGPWSANLSQRLKSGYTDQTPDNKVRSYQLWDAMLTYGGIKGLTLQGGIKNLFDQDPPFSNQGSTFQANYDPRLTDPLGRTYVAKVAYRF